VRRHAVVGFIEANGAGTLVKGLLVSAIAVVAVFASAGSASAASFGPLTASDVLSSSAHISGELDTEGEDVEVTLLYQKYPPKPGAYQGAGSTHVSATTEPAEVGLDITGLEAGTKYVARFSVSSANSSFLTEEVEFTTLPAPPPVVLSIDAPTEITNTSALISGEVERPVGSDPGFDVTCKVEYISDAHYMQTQNEQQEFRIGIPEGTYTLVGFEGDETAPLPADATVAEFQAALETLPSIGPSAVTVSGSVGNYRTYLIEFIGPLSDQNVPDVGLNGSGLIGGGELSFNVVVEGRSQGYQDADSVPCAPDLITSAGATTVTAKLGGMSPNSSYHYRIVATNAGGRDLLEGSSLFVTKAAPVPQTLGITGLGATTATLGGQLSPSNSPEVTYQFEWGETTAYGHLAPAAAADLPFTDNAFHAVSASIGGLEPATEYHYRLVATNTQTGEAAQGRDRSFVTLPSGGPGACPNESSRIGPSAGLPDCRAFELATPDLNNTNVLTTGLPVRSLADGSGLLFITFDAPGEAKASTINQPVVSRRGPDGWHTRSLGALSPEPAETFASIAAEGLVSPDFTQSLFYSSTPMGTNRPAGELNLFLRKPDDSIVPVSEHGPTLAEAPGVNQFGYSVLEARASEDFSHIFYTSRVQQLPGYPNTFSTYDWTEAGGVKPIGILPAEGSTPEEPAPSGVRVVEGSLPASSRDGTKVLFETLDISTGAPGAPLYLRVNGEETVEVTKSESSSPEPGPAKNVRVVGITADGSKVLFTSSSQLTDDANTGEIGNGEVRKGADLYSFDVAARTLTDLTVDDNPEDAATGAGVIYTGKGLETPSEAGNSLPYASKDGSSIYFVAEGKLAPGAEGDGPSLYVLRDGEIRFVAPASGMLIGGGIERLNRGFYSAPDGGHAVFVSTENLTGYDSGGEPEVYKYSYGTGSIECASCPSDSGPASGGALIEERAISDDGSRVFFTSTDAVLPGLTSGLERAYEYTNGKVSLLSPADAKAPVRLVTASASGDDVFLRTYEELVPGVGHSFAIYDARVNADTFVPAASECQGEACRGTGTSAPGGSETGSAQFQAPGEVVAPHSKAVRGRKAKLRINLPDGGQLKVTGKGIKSVKKKVARGGAVTVVVTLNGSANKKRLKKGAFKTRARVQFTPQAGASAGSAQVRTVVSLTFRGPSKKKGGK
jgi:hypothetical protein